MRKFLLLFVSVFLALSVSALNRNFDGSNFKLRNDVVFGNKAKRTMTISSMKKVSDATHSIDMLKTKDSKATRAGEADIEGTWVFTVGDWYFQNSVLGAIEIEYEASYVTDRNTGEKLVCFEDPTQYEWPFYASFDEATGILTFSPRYIGRVTAQDGSTAYIAQDPFYYDENAKTDDEVLRKQAIEAVYDATDGSITFGMDYGISWPVFEGAEPVIRNGKIISKSAGYAGIYDMYGAEKINWTEMENGQFKENLIYGLFEGEENTTFVDVRVLEHPEKPGLFKVKDPYQVFYKKNGWGASPDLLIDAADPEYIMIEMQSFGITSLTGSMYYLLSQSWYSYVIGEPMDADFAITMDEDEVGNCTITMPLKSTFVLDEDQLYFGSMFESVLKFKRPGAGVKDMVVDSDSAPRYFNLQGVEVSNPERGSMVIKVQGNKATKMLVK